jgi:O-antigen/teichoic acid export membrane protein
MLSKTTAARFARVTKGTLANVIGQALNVAGQLALVPVLLSSWGNQTYGEWLALSAMVAYLTTLDLGMQSYVINRLNQCNALNKMEDYTRLLHTGLLVNIVIPMAGFVLMLPLIFTSPIAKWLHLRDTDPTTAAWVTALLSLQVVYSIGYGMLNGVYRTIDDYSRGQMISNVRYALNLILTIVAVASGVKMKGLALVQLLLLVATSIYVYVDISRRRPDINVGLSHADWRMGLRFIGPSSMFLGIQLIAAISIQGSTLLVNAMFGAGTLVVFASLRTVSNLIKQAGSTVQHALWPELTALDAQSNRDSLRTLHLLGAKAVMSIAVCATVFLMIMGDDLIQFWTRGRVQYDPTLMIAFMILACSQSQWFCSSVLLSAVNHQKTVLQYTTVSSVAGFVAGYFLARWLGVVGFVYGLTITDFLVCALPIPARACKLIGESRRRFFFEVTARSVLVLGATYVPVKVVLPLSGTSGVGAQQFLSAALLICAFGGVAAYVVGLNGYERNRVNAALAGILAR